MELKPGMLVVQCINNGYDFQECGVGVLRLIEKTTYYKEKNAWKAAMISDIYNFAAPDIKHHIIISERTIDKAVHNKQNIIKLIME